MRLLSSTSTGDKIHRNTADARDHEVREHIPHTWASSNDNLFQSNFSAWSKLNLTVNQICKTFPGFVGAKILTNGKQVF